jgi:hypothetical protein
MQVNKHVWRGFYNLSRLEWDLVYNTSADAQILIRLMRGVAEHSSVTASGDQSAAIARSAYSSYNGGPGAYNRWRHVDEPARQIDEAAFWDKYLAMSAGQSFDILKCAVQWEPLPGIETLPAPVDRLDRDAMRILRLYSRARQ